MPDLVIVTSDAETAALWMRRTEAAGPATSVLLDDAAESGIDSAANLLIDIDLSDTDTLQKLIAALRRTPLATGHRVFAVNPSLRREVVQAEVLGATALLTRDPRPSELVAALTGVRLPDLVQHAGEPAVLRAGLDAGYSLVSHVLSAEPVDPTFIRAAAREMAEVVETQGIRAWIDAVRRHHEGTSQHCLLVSGLAMAFAAHLGFRRDDRQIIGTAAALHDIGKSKVPAAVLDKVGPLTPQEWVLMRDHPGHGHRMLLEAGGHDDVTLDAVRHHHERLDGSGYPDGLSGGRISDPTRLISIVDVYGAMLERRSYKGPVAAGKAFERLLAQPGELDPDLVRAFRPVAFACGDAAPASRVSRPSETAA